MKLQIVVNDSESII